jgi:hypothetical protein
VPTDNVVPIDAEVARAIARRAVKFRWLVAGLAALWLGLLIPVLLFTPLPPLVPFLVLGALLVLAEHRFVLFGDETSMSGSIIVAIASVFVFADTAPYAGPMLVAALGGVYLPHIRERRTSVAISNAAGFSLSAVAAASLVAAVGYRDTISWPTVATCVVAAVVADWIVNSFIVGIASAVRCGDVIPASIRAQFVSDPDVLALAIAVGALSVMNADRALVIEVLGVCLVLAAFEIRLQMRREFDTKPSRSSSRYLQASLVAVAVLVAWGNPGLGAVVLVALALFLVQAIDGAMMLPGLSGLAVAGSVTAVCSTMRIPSIAATACVLAAAFAMTEVATAVGRLKRSEMSLQAWTLGGLMMLGRRELAVLGLLAVAFSAAISGLRLQPTTLAVAFVIAAALVNRPTSRRTTAP